MKKKCALQFHEEMRVEKCSYAIEMQSWISLFENNLRGRGNEVSRYSMEISMSAVVSCPGHLIEVSGSRLMQKPLLSFLMTRCDMKERKMIGSWVEITETQCSFQEWWVILEW